MDKTALVVGATGIVGAATTSLLTKAGWRVSGLARQAPGQPGVAWVAADLNDAPSLQAALADLRPSRVFITTWSRQTNEAENIRVNRAMVRNLLDALRGAECVDHVALVTGLKHYLGPFEAYGKGVLPQTPFREDQGRLDVENFYYAQEDEVFEAAERDGFTWSVHRPHSMIGYALGNAMNMGVTLAVYATLCRETGQPFVFPGSHLQWNALTDVTDARLLAQHLEWAALTPEAHNQAFNIVNGDVFRWRWLWPQLAAYFGVEAAPPPDPIAPLELKMKNIAPVWQQVAAKHNLIEPSIEKLASWWHTDGDLGRQLECVNDMTKSRILGFHDYQPTPASFTDLFDRLRSERIIP